MGKYTGILLCSDFDGTLYNGREIPKENIKAIKHFRDNGGLFSVVSGRDSAFLHSFFEGYSFGVPVINYNGAVMYDFDRREIISEHFMSGITAEIIERIRKEIPEVCRFSFFQPGRVTRERIDKNASVDPSRIENLYKFAVNIEGGSADFVAGRDKLREMMTGYTVVRSYEDYVEILDSDYTKSPSAQKLKKMVGADLLVCVGDYENDIEMVKNADIGYAVANAVEELKDVADRLTVSVDDSAIARIIEQL